MATRATIADVTASIIAVVPPGSRPRSAQGRGVDTVATSRGRRCVVVGHQRPRRRCFSPRRTAKASRIDSIPYFVDNEFRGGDVNQWTTLARDPDGVTTLARATGGALESSARYRESFHPLGLGDELRAVLRTGRCLLGTDVSAPRGRPCLHDAGRNSSSGRLAPHLAEGLRAGLLMDRYRRQPTSSTLRGWSSSIRSGELVAATTAGPGLVHRAGHGSHSARSGARRGHHRRRAPRTPSRRRPRELAGAPAPGPHGGRTLGRAPCLLAR